MTHYTIGQLARLCAVSRTTLLYYEKRGLLAPAARSSAGYRRYTGSDLARLRQVCDYRAMGLTLDAIGTLLASGDRPAVIGARLDAIHREMAQLREQQAVLVRLLSGPAALPPSMDKASWTALFAACGMDDADMQRWHALFERQNPAAHRAFLLSLGISEQEAARIQAASSDKTGPNCP